MRREARRVKNDALKSKRYLLFVQGERGRARICRADGFFRNNIIRECVGLFRGNGRRQVRKLNRRRCVVITLSEMADLACIRVVIISMVIRAVRALERMHCENRLSQDD